MSFATFGLSSWMTSIMTYDRKKWKPFKEFRKILNDWARKPLKHLDLFFISSQLFILTERQTTKYIVLVKSWKDFYTFFAKLFFNGAPLASRNQKLQVIILNSLSPAQQGRIKSLTLIFSKANKNQGRGFESQCKQRFFTPETPLKYTFFLTCAHNFVSDDRCTIVWLIFASHMRNVTQAL